MSRIRVAYTAGAAIGPDLFRFYRSIGINMKQLYGATETCAYVCLQPDGDIKLDSVGKPAPGVEVKIAENGEVLVQSAAMLKEYYKRPDATAESIDGDGYFHTGDAGIFDADGHLKIIDRAKDVGKLANGALFAPNYVENKLKFFSLHQGSRRLRRRPRHGVRVRQHRHVGGRQLGGAARHRVFGLHRPRRPREEVCDLVQECVEKVNAELARDPVLLPLAGAPLPGPAQGARSRRRRADPHAQGAPGFIAEKYGVLIDALYSEQAERSSSRRR